MIHAEELCKIGTLLKPHGIKGEFNAEFDDYDIDLTDLSCIVLNMDGIFVPFYMDSVREKSACIRLIHIDGITDEFQAKEYSGKTIYALRRELPEEYYTDNGNGFYVSDLIGYKVFSADDHSEIGVVESFDDSTENVLLIIKSSQDPWNEIIIPITPEFIIDIDSVSGTLIMDLPEGLTSLN